MTNAGLFWLAAAVWIGIGIGISIVMGRRGHNAFGWLVIGAVLGPLSVLIALAATLQESERSRFGSVLSTSVPGPGPVDVLVGIDGSPESAGALQAVLRLLGSRVGRLSLVGVVDYDAADPANPGEVERKLRVELVRQQTFVRSQNRHYELAAAEGHALQPEVVVLTGAPARALTNKAAAEGYDLVVVGTRGRGLTKALMGSVARELAVGSKVPVLLAGAGDESSTADAMRYE